MQLKLEDEKERAQRHYVFTVPNTKSFDYKDSRDVVGMLHTLLA
jgi:hypothetical protein